MDAATLIATVGTGQLVFSVVVDHFAGVGFEVAHRASPLRILGCGLMIAGLGLIANLLAARLLWSRPGVHLSAARRLMIKSSCFTEGEGKKLKLSLYCQLFRFRSERNCPTVRACEEYQHCEPFSNVVERVLGVSWHEADAKKGSELLPGSMVLLAILGETYAAAAIGDEAHKILDQLNERSKQQCVMPYLLAKIYAGLGRKDDAIDCLEKSYHTRAPDGTFES